MKFVDYNYIATMIGDFSRVPIMAQLSRQKSEIFIMN